VSKLCKEFEPKSQQKPYLSNFIFHDSLTYQRATTLPYSITTFKQQPYERNRNTVA